MVEGKKKRKKLKKLVKKDNVKQKATQITKVNIKIGDDKKKSKKKKKKKTIGGEPGRLRRRPHLPSNPMIGAINFTPPPGYMTPNDIRNLYAQPPPPPPPPPPLPQAVLQDGQVVEGQPVAAAPRPAVVQGARPRIRPLQSLKERIVGFGPAPARSERSVSFAPSVASSQSFGGGDNSPVPSFGTSAGAASPRSVLRNRDWPGSDFNPAPSENAIRQEQQRAQAARLAFAGLSLGGGLMSVPSSLVRQSSTEPQAGSDDGDESKEEQLALGSVNSNAYSIGQGMAGIRTGGSIMGSGGGNGLMQGGATAMGNQGSIIDQPIYYKSGPRKGELRTEKRGGARAGAGRKKGSKNKRQIAPLPEFIDETESQTSSRLEKLGKRLGIGISKKRQPLLLD